MNAEKNPGGTGDEDRRSVLAEIQQALADRRFDEAAGLLERLTDAEPDCAEALALMGTLLDARGHENAAFHEYRRALALDPSLALARDGLQRYCQRKGLNPDDPRINPAAAHDLRAR